jgi:hypothetical protein
MCENKATPAGAVGSIVLTTANNDALSPDLTLYSLYFSLIDDWLVILQ